MDLPRHLTIRETSHRDRLAPLGRALRLPDLARGQGEPPSPWARPRPGGLPLAGEPYWRARRRGRRGGLPHHRHVRLPAAARYDRAVRRPRPRRR
ncbi:hypothetical protein [Streptomyces sp. NPDC127098]|uniref:hypothetical protein n=1 Tax=Streptomyces sp. NPDC127098 TaxID=3347137 RepID=UPI00364C4CBA